MGKITRAECYVGGNGEYRVSQLFGYFEWAFGVFICRSSVEINQNKSESNQRK